MPPKHYLASVRDRLAASRFFTISLALHVIIVAVFGTKILIERTVVPREMEASFLPNASSQAEPPPKNTALLPPGMGNPVPTTVQPSQVIQDDVIRSINPAGQSITPQSLPGSVITELGKMPALPNPGPANGLTAAQLKDIKVFTEWREPSRGEAAFTFTAFLGRYQGGNWNSTVRVQNGEITGGSLPNLLYAMSKWSKNRIKTNEREVKAIDLDSPELLTARPPFIFLTGTRDFKLTDSEIENVRNYLRLGGAIWGDSSVPGKRSAFDLAFRREMRRVLPDADQKFEPLAENHEIFANGYYKQIRTLPGGVNHYREPVHVLRWSGEIAVIHTANDYGDMWQVGLDQNGQIDTSRNERGEYIALNATLWNHRETYVRNLEQPAVEQAYQFGINMVLHLLTRWEDRLGRSTAL